MTNDNGMSYKDDREQDRRLRRSARLRALAARKNRHRTEAKIIEKKGESRKRWGRRGRRKRTNNNVVAAITSLLCLPDESIDDVGAQIWRTASDYDDVGFLELHPPLRHDYGGLRNHDEEEEQTYGEYVEMANREPNEQGTGRFVLDSRRRKIGLLDLLTRKVHRGGGKGRSVSGGSTKMRECRVDRMARFLEAYLGLSVDVRRGGDEGIALFHSDVEGKRRGGVRIDDCRRGLSFPLSTFRTNDDGSMFLVDVFSIFDVAVEYIRPTEYCLLVLTDAPLGERLEHDDHDDDHDGSECNGEVQEVLGRACGDRVAVVRYGVGAGDAELFGTAAHELLHTIGFDHTSFWQCIMNPSFREGGEWLFLAPHNLRKLANFLGEEGNDRFVLDRYQALLDMWWEVFDRRSAGVKENYDWLKRKISMLER